MIISLQGWLLRILSLWHFYRFFYLCIFFELMYSDHCSSICSSLSQYVEFFSSALLLFPLGCVWRNNRICSVFVWSCSFLKTQLTVRLCDGASVQCMDVLGHIQVCLSSLGFSSPTVSFLSSVPFPFFWIWHHYSLLWLECAVTPPSLSSIPLPLIVCLRSLKKVDLFSPGTPLVCKWLLFP